MERDDDDYGDGDCANDNHDDDVGDDDGDDVGDDDGDDVGDWFVGGRNIQCVQNSSPCILTCNGNYAFCGRCSRTMAKNNRDLLQHNNNSNKISIFTLQIKVSLSLRYLG